MRMSWRQAFLFVLLVLVLVLLVGLLIVLAHSRLPSGQGRTVSTALSVDEAHDTALGRAIQPLVIAHPGLDGSYLLDDARVAFSARVLLARHAERTIDAQYYIWQNDITGTILLAELERAAQRGVRVRLLLDDNGLHGLDETLAALAEQPNIEVRLFNPFTFRSPKWANFATAFFRLNHRMHNKSFTVDNGATIVGGRNIGDTYFAATDDILFADLDVLTIGPVVPQVSDDFDRYWVSPLAYPVDRIVSKPPPDALAKFHARQAALEHDPAASAYKEILAKDQSVKRLLETTLALTWAPTRMLSDPPSKALGGKRDGNWMLAALAPVFDGAKESLDLVSPYLVLGANGARDLAAMARRGVDVRVLSNSLAANDVAVVHSGYAKRRKKLLVAGVKLYEWPKTHSHVNDRDLTGPFGSSGSSLHAKTFAIDEKRLFVGSFNFDMRSANLNTEMGFLIESPALAHAMHTTFHRDAPQRAYQVGLDADGDLYWLYKEDGKMLRTRTEPDTTWTRRTITRVLEWLPIDWLL